MPDYKATLFDPAKTFDDNFDNGPYLEDKPNYVNDGEPQHNFLGHKLYAPYGIAAGSLPTSKHVIGAFKRGFDLVTYKTQRSVQFPCNEFPNVVYVEVDGDLTLTQAEKGLIAHKDTDQPLEKLTITNSFGNPSRGPDFWLDDMKKAVAGQGKGQLMIANVVGTIQPGFSQEDYYQDFAEAAKVALSAGAPVIELNLSCPNVANEGIICYTYDAVIDIARRVKEAVGDTPVLAKIGYFNDEQQDLLEKIVTDTKEYLAGFAAINTIPAKVVDEAGNQFLPGEGRLKSGICGAGIKWAGIDMVKRLDAIRNQKGLSYEIIGIGGVMAPEDYHDYVQAGANAVQSVTAAMWNDQLAAQIKDTF